MMMIVGLCGFIGSGKDAAAEALVAQGFKRLSFAQSLKDAVAAVFGWDRELLEGSTEESRAWRETIDAWWAERLDIPCLTPRWVLQHFGLVMRDHFHGDVWTASLEKRLAEVTGDVVISDARFPNELAMIKAAGGVIIRVARGDEPAWYELALAANEGGRWSAGAQKALDAKVHSSETAWIGYKFDHVIRNDGSLEDLKSKITSVVED